MPSLESIANHIETINNELDKARQHKYINLKKIFKHRQNCVGLEKK